MCLAFMNSGAHFGNSSRIYKPFDLRQHKISFCIDLDLTFRISNIQDEKCRDIDRLVCSCVCVWGLIFNAWI